ncbi:hypothetical protein PISMIDRAFT_94220 [Pisolithus microcarpus 441]|uniref:Unplaced genomic scaffold scaffold_15, whole genome shotgun sequence n=1 Tax=Pisolithus microcarpus 441 TaxID=765257 RepID=A0A0C9ZX78_9AGAM|nr:hypothetical protein PISMIDRAFT_94220 [Pisolithus microcarpus 441]
MSRGLQRVRHNFPWWAKYNYVLSAALDSGLAVSVSVIFSRTWFHPPSLPCYTFYFWNTIDYNTPRTEW